MSLSPCPSYTSQDAEWIGALPDHWLIIPLKRGFRIEGGSTPSPEEENWNGDLAWVTPADLSRLNSKFLNTSKRTITAAGFASCGTTLLPTGSLILSTRAPIGSLAIAARTMCTNQGCKGLVPNQNISSSYFFYVLLIAKDELNIRGSGTTFLEISGDELKRFVVPMPPLAEQTQIARFLDYETARIDTLIAEQQRLIELLKEKRQSIVLSALDDKTLPLIRLDHAVDVITRPVKQREGESYTAIGLFNRDRGLFHKEPREMQDMGDSDFYWIKSGDLIISGQFAWEGAVAMAGINEEGLVVSHRYPVLRGKNGFAETEYIYALLATKHGDFLLNENSRGAAGRNRPLNLASLLKEKIRIPPQEVQQKVSTLVRHEANFLAKCHEQIGFLQERRSAVISVAVTGKIDVRNWKPPAESIRTQTETEAMHG